LIQFLGEGKIHPNISKSQPGDGVNFHTQKRYENSEDSKEIINPVTYAAQAIGRFRRFISASDEELRLGKWTEKHRFGCNI